MSPTREDRSSGFRLGLGFKLWGAFLAISLLSVATAWVGLRGFRTVLSSQDQVAAHASPQLSRAYELARSWGAIAAELPNLADASSMTSLLASRARLEAHLQTARDSFPATSDSPMSPELLEGVVDEMGRLVLERLDLEDEVDRAVAARVEASRGIVETLEPLWIRGQETRSRSSSASSTQAPSLVDAGPIQQIQLDAYDGIKSAALTTAERFSSVARVKDAAGLARIADEIQMLRGEMAGWMVDVFDASLRARLAKEIAALSTVDDSARDPLTLRREALQREVAIAAKRTEAQRLSEQLVERTDERVRSARAAIDAAMRDARETTHVAGRWLAGLAIVALVLSTLIVVQFVFRGIVHRLNALIASMRQLSDGQTDLEIPPGGADELGDMSRAIEVFRDNAERLAVQEKSLKNQAEELREKNEELGQLVRVASHDLRSPLRAVSHLASWVLEDSYDDVSERSKGHLEALVDRVQRMDALLDDLLNYMGLSGPEVPRTAVSIPSVTEEVMALIDLPPGFVVKASLEARPVVCAAVPLKLALRNLVDNAVKHHDRDEGTVEIRCRLEGAALHVSVTDDGPGISSDSPDDAIHMFRRFSVPRTGTPGSGIGLALVRKAIETVDGEVSLETQMNEGRGTRVAFHWPCEPASLTQGDTPPAPVELSFEGQGWLRRAASAAETPPPPRSS